MSDQPQLTEIHLIAAVDLKHLFDLATDSLLVCSGNFDTDDVNLLRRIADAIGVEPESITPDEFLSQYPHRFRRRIVPPATVQMIRTYATRRLPGWDGNPDTEHMYRQATGRRQETADEVRARIDEAKADPACQVIRCGKPKEDEIHV